MEQLYLILWLVTATAFGEVAVIVGLLVHRHNTKGKK